MRPTGRRTGLPSNLAVRVATWGLPTRIAALPARRLPTLFAARSDGDGTSSLTASASGTHADLGSCVSAGARLSTGTVPAGACLPAASADADLWPAVSATGAHSDRWSGVSATGAHSHAEVRLAASRRLLKAITQTIQVGVAANAVEGDRAAFVAHSLQPRWRWRVDVRRAGVPPIYGVVGHP